MHQKELNRELLTFLDESPCNLWAVYNMRCKLEAEGFIALSEAEPWKLEPGRGYYVTRGGTALIAFRMPAAEEAEGPGETAGAVRGFQIISAHCDSPLFKVKPGGGMNTEGYLRLNVEKYGGAMLASWLDRPLSVAGRALVRTKEGVASRLFCVRRDLLIIPDVAIHMNRKVNDGYVYNLQTDLAPLLGQEGGTYKDLLGLIAAEIGVQAEDILDADICLYNRTPASVLGLNEEFIASGRLDDLQCAFGALKGFLAAAPGKSTEVLCIFDSEEVGSTSRQGASSTFLRDTLYRICSYRGMEVEGFFRALAESFMISTDNAHSVHPNHPEKTDPVNRPVMNGGIVIKYSSDQKYTTDGISGALMRRICEMAKVPYQVFTNRSDMPGGSTLGRLSSAQVPVRAVDIGLAQLSMHASYETAGAKDTAYLVEAAKVFFSSSFRESVDGTVDIIPYGKGDEEK